MQSPVQGRLLYRVPYADTDQMKFVYYANYLVYFERARNELMRSLGLPYRELEARGYGLPVITAHVDYKAPAAYDDELELRASVGWLRGVRMQVDCQILCDGRLLASGYTIHAVMTMATHHATRLPDDLAAIFTNGITAEEACP